MKEALNVIFNLVLFHLLSASTFVLLIFFVDFRLNGHLKQSNVFQNQGELS